MSANERSREQPSPYRPGYGTRPLVLAGRKELIDDVEDAIETLAAERRAPAAVVIVGARGVGKSVMLDELADIAQAQHGWVRMHIQKDAGSTLNERIIESAREAEAALRHVSPGRADRFRLKEIEVTGRLPFAELGLSFAREAPATASPAVEVTRRLRTLANLVTALDTAVVVTIDEAQDVSAEEFGSFGAFGQEITRLDLPFLVALGGLPSLDHRRLATYFVRADRHELGPLNRAEAREGLIRPAADAGRPFEEPASDLMLDHIGGYPYALQLYGREAWRASRGQPTITLAAVQTALPLAARRLDRTVHRDHWEQSSPGERRYLVAVAELQRDRGVIRGGDVAGRLERSAQQVSTFRARLLARGSLVFADGSLQFATPGMGAYVLRMATELETNDASRRVL